MKKHTKRRKEQFKKLAWAALLMAWAAVIILAMLIVAMYFLKIKSVPFEGKYTIEDCMTLQENSMRSICLIRLSDNELFKNGAQICEVVWEWRGGGSHDMRNECYARTAKVFKDPEYCKLTKKYGFNVNSMYNPAGYDSSCLKQLFKSLTDSELAKIKLESICNNLTWQYVNDKNSCLNKYK